MIKFFSLIIYSFLSLINFLLKKIFKKNILVWIKFYIERDSYERVKLRSGKNLKFFVPNYLTNLLVKEFYLKEPETIHWIDNFDKTKNITFWDIGSNIGLYSIYAASTIKDISVVSFEPSTSNLRILSRNISINKLSEKIKIFQLPLGEKENKFLNFYERKFNEGDSHNSIDENIDFEGKKIKKINSYNIFSTNINKIIEDEILDVPDYIKIDVDGIEHLILKGGDKLLKNLKVSEIQIEINENFKEQMNNVMKIMRENNFKFKEKKRNEKSGYYSNEKYSKFYNYYFTR